jgi:small subunit ribosomal protein S1
MSSDRPANAGQRDEAAVTTETVADESAGDSGADVRPAEPVSNGSAAPETAADDVEAALSDAPDRPSETEAAAGSPPAHSESTPSADALQPESTEAANTPPNEAQQSTQAPAELEAGTNESPAPADSAEPAKPGEESAPEARPRRRLNPTVNEDEAKPIPSYAPAPQTPAAAAPSQQTADSPADTALEAAAHSAMQTQESAPAETSERQPVELPPKVDDLGADLEAEIAAAMSAGDQGDAAVEAQTATDETQPALSEETLEQGTKLVGTVQSIHGDNVFLDVKLRSPGVVQLRQFDAAKRPSVGQMMEVVVDRVDAEEGLIQCSLPKGIRRPAGDWDAVSVGQIVDCTVTKTNKGGLEVNISNLRGFLPVSQVDLKYVENLEPFVGQKLRVKIIEVKPQKRNLVVSRRAYLEIEREEAEKELWAKLEVGQDYTGTVKTIKPYGAFVDIGGVDGFLHIGDISWSRINHPSEVLQEGQQVDLKVISLDPEKKKIGLSLRQMAQNPWTDIENKYPIGSTVHGTVTRTTNFGAFVQLEPGVEGLIHISELEYRRVSRVTEVLKVGQEVDAQVLQVDPERQRIGLSLKALQAKPEPPAPPADEDLAPSANEPESVRKRQGPLKGGIGGKSGQGGLFGNPNDFS